MSIVGTFKELVFKETSDPGKVGLIIWNTEKTGGVATLLVPVLAYDRAPYRAALRALHIKAPEAKKVIAVERAVGIVRYPTANYYLVKAKFILYK